MILVVNLFAAVQNPIVISDVTHSVNVIVVVLYVISVMTIGSLIVLSRVVTDIIKDD
ncbi:hypothetical protein ACOI1C_08235 [Bacillus sp. DJP31]|uniref:hypothetical protein n=1 Tax=Bacillus sp. DJP31 TaxID=3409789 RepID=UPI003BB5380C